MPTPATFWIIGETSLSIQCAQALLDRGHVVRGIASDHELVAGWAREHGIPLVARFADLAQALRLEPYDYLLSIVNARILKADILETPRIAAINFHDGPLPRYAGMHSTSWALLNREGRHGITWHRVVAEVDAGEIFVQREVEIAPDDTALSLNARCYEAALEGFIELADAIGAGRLAGRAQDLSLRTYYPRLARPDAAGLIRWDRPAREISALVRALDFGPAYPNPLAAAKVEVQGQAFLCRRLRVTAHRSGAPAGTISSANADGVTVTTADHDVVIEAIETLGGAALPLDQWTAQHRLAPGTRLGPERGDPDRQRLSALNEQLAPHEGHWVRALGRTRPAELPWRQRESGASGAMRRQPFRLPPGTAAVGPFVPVLLAGAAAHLSRIAGEREIHFGLELPQLHELVKGFEHLFSTRLPLSLEVTPGAAFSDLVEAARSALATAERRQTFARDIQARFPELRREGLGIDRMPFLVRIDANPDSVPATGPALVVDIRSDGSDAALWTDPGATSEADARRITDQLVELLRSAADAPDTPAGRLSMVPPDERRRLLVEWNATDTPYERDATIHQLFERRAAMDPDAVAVTFGESGLTYAELEARADAWAGHLRLLGVGRDTLVGLRTRRTPDLVVGLLAVLKAGGAYLPLDPSLPAERTRFMIEDAALEIILTQRDLAGDLSGGIPHVLHLDEDIPEAPQPRGTVPDSVPAEPESLAYVIYTSGSTGTPKGVLVHHRGVVNYLSWCMEFYRAGEGSGSPVHSPASFDLTVTSLLAPLLAGSPVHLLEEALGVEALATALRSRRDHTLVKLTPSHLDLLSHQLTPEEARGCASAFVIGGESLSGPATEFWLRHAPEARLINEYGPTETVVGCCVYEMPRGETAPAVVPIGRPIANTRLYVLDDAGELLPEGVAGELYIGGDGVARGYLNRPDLTAERFVPDRFRPDGGRLYRTGDRVRYLPGGILEFLGRLDGQVKLRGYRIELGEIEATIARHPAVGQAAALLWSGGSAGPRITAWYTATGAGPAAGELHDWCLRFLPEYMVPASFEPIGSIPLTANGKLDRAALPAPSSAAHPGPVVAPRSDTERKLVAIWSDLLGTSVGITDNFFELGGHSLLAVRMISRVREELGVAPPLSVLLTKPTVEHVAAALEPNTGPELAHDDDPLIFEVREGDGRPPFFYMHGDFAGSGFYVETLARQLDPGQGLYAIRPTRPGDPPSIEGMAQHVRREIRAIQPVGPYLLGGLCNGGAVAYEVARQLRGAGEVVELLALVNTAHRNAHLRPARALVRRLAGPLRLGPERERAIYLRARESLLRTMVRQPWHQGGREPIGRAWWWARLLARTAARAVIGPVRRMLRKRPGEPAAPEAKPIRDDMGVALIPDSVRLPRYRYIDGAMREYAAGPLDAPVAVIWWEESESFDWEPELHGGDLSRGWADLCRSVTIRRLPRLHNEPLRDPEPLGRELAELIRQARPETPDLEPAGRPTGTSVSEVGA